jgi:diaminopropionate ammonia-lyase
MTNGNKSYKWVFKEQLRTDLESIKTMFSWEIARQALAFHQQIPNYKMTSLINLSTLAKELKVGGIWVKNEAERLNLNSFKGLGGTFALYRFIQEKLNIPAEKMSYDYLVSPEVKKALGFITFASATDGNHGRGLAWAAQQLGHNAVIYVHSDTSEHRIEAIREFGAIVKVIKGNYDDAVNQIIVDSEANGWQIISDTSWQDYYAIPTYIMQGYGTIVLETQMQLNAQAIEKPTHIFVQAGVGALAASIFGFYHTLFNQNSPKCITVEPTNAACLLSSIESENEEAIQVGGSLETIMAGLSCGQPSLVAWETLRRCVDLFVAVDDYHAARGMRLYASPLGSDQRIISGESGAVTLGLLYALLKDKQFKELKEKLHIDKNSQILLINTEGDTDPDHYRQVVWEGANPTP